MDAIPAKGVTVTFTPVFDNRYLFVQRQKDDPILGGYWGFPGGKVHVGETLATAMVRELAEETGLRPTGRAFFVDSYLLGDRVGAHFAVEVTHNRVALQELEAHAWVQSIEDMLAFAPRIPGIENHLHYILKHFAGGGGWQTLEQFDLIKDRFLHS